MLWDCERCGTVKLLGLTHRHCPACGAAQDPKRRYYPEPGAEVAVEDSPFHGADKVCGACDTPNAAVAAFCVGCGAPLDGARAVVARAAQHAAGGAFAADDAAKAAAEVAARKAADEATRASAAAKAAGVRAPAARRPWWLLVVVALVLVVCCGGLAALLWKQDAALTVTGHTWERSVAIERLDLVAEQAWQGSVPAGATGVACRQEQRDTRQVPDGQDCHDVRVDQGDGTFVSSTQCTPRFRAEPIYDTRCSYRIPRWQQVDVVRSTGVGLLPAWPAVVIPQPGTCVGCGREGARAERLVVALADAAGTAFTCELPEARWSEMPDGSRWSGSVGVVTGALDCDGLAPAP